MTVGNKVSVVENMGIVDGSVRGHVKREQSRGELVLAIVFEYFDR